MTHHQAFCRSQMDKIPVNSYLSKISFSIALFILSAASVLAEKPNIVLVITDDQGYGDIGAHGNEMIVTPALDKLWAESLRLTNFHVDPTCAPTRCALMSGRYSTRTGIWHTIMGRSMMDSQELTIAEALKSHGYATGHFGKWHLGDSYPFRPQDQGFDTVVWHKAGGVGQGPDYWGNDYFDDTYWRGDKTEAFKGYCTDIWFEEGMKFIKGNKNKPFFAYISTNAPHSPLNVDPKYSEPYVKKGVSQNMAKFYGMITNIDENVTKLRRFLEDEGLSENTIFIFMTDNGTAGGMPKTSKKKEKKGKKSKEASATSWKGFNAGMSGKKGSNMEGGHRVPFFLHWPKAKLNQGMDISNLTAHIDILPTLLDLIGLQKPHGPKIDGQSLKPLFFGQADKFPKDRTLAVHSQRIEIPQKWKTTALMTERWRLLGDNQLYDIKADPAQKSNVAQKYPEIVKRLSGEYDQWWNSFEPNFSNRMRFILGSDEARTSDLMSHDWLVSRIGDSPWHQGHVKSGKLSSGPWAVEIATAGRYRITLTRWAPYLKQAMNCKHAKLKIGEVEKEMPLKSDDEAAVFEVDLEKGPAMLQSWLTNDADKIHGAYYAVVTRL
ncbi:MAG: arylsulfatase [Planctomycetes bacterium]|nr:arylsulfatase [Planctomycetota bacterium]